MPRSPVQALQRSAAILDLLGAEADPLGITDLARRLRLAKPTVHRLASTLEAAGMLARTTDAKYRLGLRLWHWGCAAVSQFNFRDAARPIMENLVRLTGETVHLAVWSEDDAVYIDRVNGSNVIRLHSSIGGRAPAHATASGLCLLAFQDAAVQAAAEQRLREFTPKTITSPAHLRYALETVRRKGYAFSAGAWHEGSAGVAAPIRSHSGEVVACLSLAGPVERIKGRAAELTELVRTAASHVSHGMGALGEYRRTAGKDSAKSGDRRPRDTRMRSRDNHP